MANSREIAFNILKSYFSKKELLKTLINQKFLDTDIPPLDKRFIYSLVKGTIRYLLYIDYAVSIFSLKDFKKIDMDVLIILRMGFFQMIFMDKVPNYSAVDESVKLAKNKVHKGASKFVNAILRKAGSIENLYEYINKDIEKKLSGLKKISIMYSFPEWIIEYWEKYYGRETVVKICKSLNKMPAHFVRFNPDIISKEKLEEKLKLTEDDIEKGAKLPALLKKANIQVKKISKIINSGFFKEGLIFIQDISSQIAVEYFTRPKPKDKILDLCAAPGGKTILLSRLSGGEANILSVDASKERLDRLRENIVRLNIRNVEIIQGDATSISLKDKFDKILIDAPCSAFGTISKNPDVKYNKRLKDLERLKKNSLKILNNSKNYLKPGGEIIFYTCTLSPIENQEAIKAFLEENKNFSAMPSLIKLPGKNDERNCLEILPHFFNSEAGFICSLKNC